MMKQEAPKTSNKNRLWRNLFLSSIFVLIIYAAYSILFWISYEKLEMNSDRELIEHFEKQQNVYSEAVDIFFDKDKQCFIFDKERNKKFTALKQKERIRGDISDCHGGNLLLGFSSAWGNSYFYNKGFVYLKTSPSSVDTVENLDYIAKWRKPLHDFQKTYEELTVVLYRPIKENWYIYVQITADLGP